MLAFHLCCNRCRLFSAEMELIDMPGVGRSSQIDKMILTYFSANDTLVYVCNVNQILLGTVSRKTSYHAC